jgi:hypothetical protein
VILEGSVHRIDISQQNNIPFLKNKATLLFEEMQIICLDNKKVIIATVTEIFWALL